MKYRADIDGLRAIAVLSVMFYHFHIALFHSGYVGVDVFFVISGYLITSIIYKEMQWQPHGFSLINFYERRVRRIFPVFFATVFLSMPWAYVFFSPKVFTDFVNSIYSVLGFVSNYFFWADNDYFSLDVHSKPLLHIWSLAIEEQFYIFFPLLLAFFIKKRKNILCGMWWVTGISLIACIVMTHFSSRTAFYWLPFRAWELLLGAILAIYSLPSKEEIKILHFSNKVTAKIVSIAALFLLLFSVTLMQHIIIGFPSYIALIPCVAALLCLELGKDQSSIVYRVLSNNILVFIGKLSYSLYLWHWLVLVCFYSVSTNNSFTLSFVESCICLGITFILSCASYFLLECPIRKRKIFSTRKSLFVSMVSIGLVLLVINIAFDKMPRLITNTYDTVKISSLKNSVRGIPNLYAFGDMSVEPTLFVMGDSHASVLYESLDSLAKKNAISGVLYTAQTPLFNTVDVRNINLKTMPPTLVLFQQEGVKNYLKTKNIKSVLFAVRWGSRVLGKSFSSTENDEQRNNLSYIYADGTLNADSVFATKTGLSNVVSFFPKGTAFYYLKNMPEFRFSVPDYAFKLENWNRLSFKENQNNIHSEVVSLREEVRAYHQQSLQPLDMQGLGISEIDVLDTFCDAVYCYGIGKKGEALFYDQDHVTIDGAKALELDLMPFIESGK